MSDVLVCDDEPQILRALTIVLRDAGFGVHATATGEDALNEAAMRRPDAAIIDLLLPGIDGIEVCRRLREWSGMPIILLSAVGDEAEKVRALEAGADDYVTKPFGPRELVARLQAGLRRAASADATPTIEVDPETYEVRADGVLLTCEPATVLPMAQRYFLY